MQKNKLHTHRRFIRLHNWPIWVWLIVSLVIVVAILECTNTTHLLHKQKAVSGVISSTKPSNSTAISSNKVTNSSSGSTQSSSSPKEGSAGTTNSQAILQAPYGTLVSNHYPGKDGSTTQEESVCNSTPGSSCYIKFVQGSVVKTLETQQVGSSGAVYWAWDTKDAGLSSGSWQIFAVASLNGQTKTAQDQLNLSVGP